MPRAHVVRRHRTVPRRRGGPGAALACALLALSPHAAAAPECAPGPAGDLAGAAPARSAAYRTRAEDLAFRHGELDLAEAGLGASIGLRPSLGVGDDLDLEQELDALDLVGYQLDATIGYRYDEVAIVKARVAVLAAEARLEAQGVADVLEAMLGFSRLRVAERALEVALVDLDVAAAALERAEQTAAERAADPEHAPLPGRPAAARTGPPPFLREARLQLRRAELGAQDARASVDALSAALAALGVGVPTAQGGACGAAPLAPPAPASGNDRARAALVEGLALARAQLARAGWGPVRDLRLQAQYQEGGGRATLGVGVAAGRPEADLALRLRPTGKDGWSVRLSANLRLDESTLSAISRAERAVAAAEAELAAHDLARDGAVEASWRAVERAWEEVEVLDEALALAVLRRDEPSEARNLPRNSQAVARARDARERGLQAYYRAYAAHLTLLGAGWPTR